MLIGLVEIHITVVLSDLGVFLLSYALTMHANLLIYINEHLINYI